MAFLRERERKSERWALSPLSESLAGSTPTLDVISAALEISGISFAFFDEYECAIEMGVRVRKYRFLRVVGVLRNGHFRPFLGFAPFGDQSVSLNRAHLS